MNVDLPDSNLNLCYSACYIHSPLSLFKLANNEHDII